MTSGLSRKDCKMSMYDRFVRDCGAAPFSFEASPTIKVGANYVFKWGKYKGDTLLEVLAKDKAYVRRLLEEGSLKFTKKDDEKLRKVLYAESERFSGVV